MAFGVKPDRFGHVGDKINAYLQEGRVPTALKEVIIRLMKKMSLDLSNYCLVANSRKGT